MSMTDTQFERERLTDISRGDSPARRTEDEHALPDQDGDDEEADAHGLEIVNEAAKIAVLSRMLAQNQKKVVLPQGRHESSNT